MANTVREFFRTLAPSHDTQQELSSAKGDIWTQIMMDHGVLWCLAAPWHHKCPMLHCVGLH